MNGKRLVVLAISVMALAMPLLLLMVSPTMALAAQTISREDDGDKNLNANGLPVIREQVIQRPVQWTLTPARCSLLQTDLMGSGQGRKTVILLRNPDGTFNYKINDEVSGIATDRLTCTTETHHDKAKHRGVYQ